MINMHSSSLWLDFNTRLSKSDHISWFRWSFNQNVYTLVYKCLNSIGWYGHMSRWLTTWCFNHELFMFVSTCLKNVLFKVLKIPDTKGVVYFCQMFSSSYNMKEWWGGPMQETRPRLEINAHSCWLKYPFDIELQQEYYSALSYDDKI